MNIRFSTIAISIVALTLSTQSFANGKPRGLKKVKKAVVELTAEVRELEEENLARQADIEALAAAIARNTEDIAQIENPNALSEQARQIQTGLDLTSGLRWLVGSYFLDTGNLPTSNAEVGYPNPEDWRNRFVAASTVGNSGQIFIEFGANAAPGLSGQTVVLTPTDPGSGTLWFFCAGDGVTDEFLAELDCAFSDPPYQPVFQVRNQINTAFDLLQQSNAQQLIQDATNANGFFPSDNASAGLQFPTNYQNNYITQLNVLNGGVISMVFGNNANTNIVGLTLTWTPLDVGGSITWICQSPTIDPIYLQPVCRN